MSNEKKITEEQNIEEKGFWTKNIISILLIVFLIISGVYAFNRDTEQQDKSVEEKVEEIKQEEAEQAEEENSDTEEADNKTEENKKEETSTDIQKTDAKITLKAQNGDGVTHLARKAIAEYSKDKSITLSKEQKLYAETVLKDKNYKHHLTPGQEVEFDVNNLSDTIQKAQNLSEKEIKAWSKYTHLVPSL